MPSTLTCLYEDPPTEGVPEGAAIVVGFADGEHMVFRWQGPRGSPFRLEALDFIELAECSKDSPVEWYARLHPAHWAAA